MVFEISFQRRDETRNRSLFTLFFFLPRSSRTWRWNLSNIDNIQKWFPYLYFFLPFPPFFFLFSPPLSVQTTFLIRHRVKEDGDLNILSRTKESSVFGYLLCLFSFFFSFFFIFCFTRRRIFSYLLVEEEKYNEKMFCKIFPK